MRPRIRTGTLVASSNRTTFIVTKHVNIEYKYVEKLSGNKIIKVNILNIKK